MDAPDTPEFWTPAQIGKRWQMSEDYVVREFQDREGVLILGRPRSRNKRGYRIIRVPDRLLRTIESERTIQ